MKRWILTIAAAASLAFPLSAGESYKCTEDTQTCLNHMVAKLKNRGWVGLELDYKEEAPPSGAKPRTGGEGKPAPSTGSVAVVKRIVPGSPAEAAGFQPGDVLSALNGIRFNDENHEALEKVREQMTPGSKVEYTILRGGKEMKVPVTLAALPSDVMAQWIGMHMLEHAQASAAPK
jgi:C-terminal processing protease CtpA/Prc